jgi:hypothetical protein
MISTVEPRRPLKVHDGRSLLMRPSRTSERRYVPVDELADTAFSHIDPMARFLRTHRRFLEQQRRRGPLFEYTPPQLVSPPQVSRTSIPDKDKAMAPLSSSYTKALQPQDAHNIDAEERRIRVAVVQAESRWRQMIDERLLRTRLERPPAKVVKRSQMQGALEAEETAHRTALLQSEAARWILLRQSKHAASTTRSTSAPSAAFLTAQPKLAELEQIARKQIMDAESLWRGKVEVFFRAKLSHFASEMRPRSTATARSGRTLESLETLRRCEVEAAELAYRNLMLSCCCALQSSVRNRQSRITLVGTAENRSQVAKWEVLQRQRILGAEHQWFRCEVDRFLSTQELLSVSKPMAVVFQQQLLNLQNYETDDRDDILAAEDVWRLVAVHWATADTIRIGAAQRPATPAHRPPTAQTSPTPSFRTHTFDATRAAGCERDEAAARSELRLREERMFGYHLTMFHRAGIQLAELLHQKETQMQRERVTLTCQPNLIRLEFSEDTARKQLMFAETRLRDEISGRQRDARSSVVNVTVPSARENCVEEEVTIRGGIERAEFGWRQYIRTLSERRMKSK